MTPTVASNENLGADENGSSDLIVNTHRLQQTTLAVRNKNILTLYSLKGICVKLVSHESDLPWQRTVNVHSLVRHLIMAYRLAIRGPKHCESLSRFANKMNHFYESVDKNRLCTNVAVWLCIFSTELRHIWQHLESNVTPCHVREQALL